MILGSDNPSNAVSSSSGITITQDTELPAAIREWLVRLLTLASAPLQYLVPDERLLPLESMRMFHVDQAWLRAALDGALSAGTPSPVERAALEARYADIVTLLEHELLPKFAVAGTPVVLTGFLLRSQLVSRWPGLRIDADVETLRQDRIAPDILLVLFAGEATWVRLVEPAGESGHGLEPDGSLPRTVADRPGVTRVSDRAGAAAGVLDVAGTGLSPSGFALATLRGLAAALFAGTGAAARGDVFQPTTSDSPQ
jgi:hypothetical protein